MAYMLVMVEEFTHLRKSKPVLVAAGLIWLIVAYSSTKLGFDIHAAEKAFKHAGLNYKDHILIDENLKRPSEVDSLLADYSKAKKILKWAPKVSFDNLIKDMVESDINSLSKDEY